LFSHLERALLEHGPQAPTAVLDDLRQQSQAIGGDVVLSRISELHEPEASADLAGQLSIVVDRLRLQAIEDELKQLFESGDLSPDAQQRGKELGLDRARLKASLTQLSTGTG
jgi:hypothetical protein